MADTAQLYELINWPENDAHDHKLHSSTALATALAMAGVVWSSDSAYYFRYLEPHMSNHAAVERLLEYELELIRTESIDPLGNRFVVACP
ncbi:MAG: hypothetical protein ABIN83_02955 [Sphingomicrobium sp.]